MMKNPVVHSLFALTFLVAFQAIETHALISNPLTAVSPLLATQCSISPSSQSAFPYTSLSNSQDENEEDHYNNNNPRFTLRDAEKEAMHIISGNFVGSWNQTTLDSAIALFHRISKMRHRQASITMERIIHRIVGELAAGSQTITHVHMIPLYETLVTSWAKSGEVEGLERAQEILEYMMTEYQDRLAAAAAIDQESSSPQIQGPSRELFNTVLWAFARSGQPNSPSKAVRFLSKWFKWYERGQCLFTPNTTSYAAVLFAYAQHDPSLQNQLAEPMLGCPSDELSYYDRSVKASLTTQQQQKFDNPKVVLGLLSSMEKLSVQYPAVKPDLLCYHKYFVAINTSAKRGQMSLHQRAILAEVHLERMLNHPDPDVHPDCWAFNSVIRSWGYSNAEESVERCEYLLRIQEDYHASKGFSADTCPLINSYNTLIGCYARSNLPDRAERAHDLLRRLEAGTSERLPRPSSTTYVNVLTAYAKSEKSNAATLAERLIMEMDQKQHEGDRAVKVSARSINVLLQIFARCNQPRSFEKVDAWLTKMRELASNGDHSFAPNRVTYLAYLQSLSKMERHDSIERAEAIVEEMNGLHEQGYHDVKPDIITFTNVLHCFATSGREDALERCLALLDHLEELHSEGHGTMRPSRRAYNCCVNAAAKSSRPGKAKVALGILRRMQSVAVGAGTVTYNNVLNACAFSIHKDDDPDEVLQIALDLLKEVREQVGANHITYMTMLRVVSTQVRTERKKWELVRELVDMCAKDGQLTKHIMHGARLNVSPMQYRELHNKVLDRRTGRYKEEFTMNVRKSELPS